MRDSRHRKTKFLSDAFATAYDTDIWTECIVGTGAVTISAGELKLDAPASTDVAALVTTDAYYCRNFKLTVTNVDVATGTPARGGIVLAPTKTVTGNPEVLQNSIRIIHDAVNTNFDMIVDVATTEKSIYTGNWTDGDGAVTLEVEPDGYFKLYEDALLRRVGTLPVFNTVNQAGFNFYIYLYTIATAATGYGLLDNFRLDLDPTPTDDTRGQGVKLNSMRKQTPVYGRFIDQGGTHDTFEVDKTYLDTPTQRIMLSRDVKRFKLTSVKAYITATNAVTCGLALFGDAQADDIHSMATKFYQSGDNTSIAKSTWFQKMPNDTTMGAIADLAIPGQVPFTLDWSAAPGDTVGMIEITGEEVE